MRTKWYLLGCLSSIIILVALIVLSISSLVKLAKTPTEPKIADNSVLYLNLSGYYEDYSVLTDRNLRFIPDTIHDIIQRVNTAKTDNRIKAIILEPQAIQTSYSSLNELIFALADFRASGKKVYGYITNATQRDIYLLGAADIVYMNPSASAGFMLHGIGGSIDFYKDMLEKLGVQMHVIKAGDYKSAGEPFTRTSMSPEFRRNITAVYDDIYNQLIADLSKNFDAPPALFRNTIERSNRLIINQEHGKDIRVVDELIFFEQFLRTINITEKHLIKYDKYNATAPRPQFNKIAVVYALGNITPTRPQFGENNINSTQFVRMLDKIETDNSIKAVVIRINSGGGSALESEIIFQKIAQVREKKPVVVSMGAVAASGGYYIAAGANHIFADPYTVTGSIGVFSMVPDLSGTADKIGINSEQVGHGKYLSLYNIWGMYNQDVEQAFQLMTEDVYHEFKTRVSQSRQIGYQDLENIAQGMIWSAPQALRHNLIDEIGLMTDAINKAAQIASVSNYSVSYYPERRSFIDVIMEENLNIPMMKMLLTNKLPEIFAKPAEHISKLYEEVKIHPVQMRMEFEMEM